MDKYIGILDFSRDDIELKVFMERLANREDFEKYIESCGNLVAMNTSIGVYPVLEEANNDMWMISPDEYILFKDKLPIAGPLARILDKDVPFSFGRAKGWEIVIHTCRKKIDGGFWRHLLAEVEDFSSRLLGNGPKDSILNYPCRTRGEIAYCKPCFIQMQAPAPNRKWGWEDPF